MGRIKGHHAPLIAFNVVFDALAVGYALKGDMQEAARYVPSAVGMALGSLYIVYDVHRLFHQHDKQSQKVD